MRLFIRHRNGEILGVARLAVLDATLAHPFALGDGEEVAELDATPEIDAQDPHQIQRQFALDVASRTLRRRS